MVLTNRLYKYLLVLPLSALMLSGCGKKEEGGSQNKALTANDTVTIQVTKAELNSIKLTKTYSGNFEGEEQANVTSKIPERIINMKIKVGDAVKEGQPIVFLDKAGSSSQYYQTEAAFLNSAKDLNRTKELLKEGAVSQQMFDGAQTSYDVAKANFEAAKNSVELIAPISGIVTAVNLNVGDVANPGLVIATVAKIHNMKAIFLVGEGEIGGFAVGQYVDVYSDQKPELIQKGKITQISKSADVTSRSFEVKAIFPNTKDAWFKPGMFCRVNTILKSVQNRVTVPNQAVQNSDKGTSIFIIENGRALLRQVQTGITDGKITEITNGIKEGETIVTVGMNNLKEGKIVRIAGR